MMAQHLRLFTGDDTSDLAMAEPPVRVTIGQISRILADAHRTKRTWLQDFSDEEVEISADLYEVLSAFWNLRPSA